MKLNNLINKKAVRFWEVDFLRGTAIIFMITFHIFFDLGYNGIFPSVSENAQVSIIGKIAFIMFLFITGISLSLSHSRAVSKGEKPKFIKYLKRGLYIFGYGIIITIITKLYFAEGFIIFGILHLIGVSIIISYPLMRFTGLNIILGFFVLISGFIISVVNLPFPWLLWLGLKPENFYTLDYFPIFPYYGLILLGIASGNYFYKTYKRKFFLPDLSKNLLVTTLTFLGRHSLFIYLVHQPIIILAIYIFS
jgi:uncharacterized membrane protein